MVRTRWAFPFLSLLAAAPSAQTPALAPAPASTPASEPARPWTVLVYGAADNNADGPILRFLDAVRRAIDGDPGIELLLLIDRSERYSTDATSLGADFTGARLFRLHRDEAERLDGGEFFPQLTRDVDAEIDSADADNLRRFIAWGKATAPAKRYGVMIYSHADGSSMCPDEESRREMGIPELTRKLGPAESVDFLALELCNMGGIEIAYQWRPGPDRFGADVLLAIPNAGPPLDWDRAFARIRSPGHSSSADEPHLDPAAMTAADFGKLVIEEGQRGRELAFVQRPGRGLHEAAGSYDLRAAAAVKTALDLLAVELGKADQKGDQRELFFAVRGPGDAHAGERGEVMRYEREGPFVDLADLCRRLAAAAALPEPTRKRAAAVVDAVDAFVLASFGMAGHEGFEPGRNGVFVLLPRATPPERWRNFRWFVPGPREIGGKDLGGWAFAQDGATAGNGVVETWFELLDHWLDTRDDSGGQNGYRI
jgi:clostripain